MQSGYRVIQMSGSGVDNDILRSRGIMALDIILPRGNVLAYKREVVLAMTSVLSTLMLNFIILPDT